MAPVLTVTGLRKRFSKNGPYVLDGFTAEFSRGITGFVGPNGAGKTTLFSVVAGFINSQEGDVDLFGTGSFDAATHKGRLGVLPQDADFDLGITPVQFLYGMARLQGYGRGESKAEAMRVLGLVNLLDNANKKIGKLSHGMRRRVAIASAILGSPELILLDEPMSGLDPLEAHRLRGLILGLGGQSAVVVSSHNLAELEKICDHVVFIDAGVCVEQASVGDITGNSLIAIWELGVSELQLDSLRNEMPSHQFEFSEGELKQTAPSDVDLDRGSIEVARILAASGVPIRGVRRGKSLEESYLETLD